jgi:hypothetical protein
MISMVMHPAFSSFDRDSMARVGIRNALPSRR